jgi:O-antigen ligase
MSMAEFIGIAIYVGIALILALILVLALGLALHAEHRYGKYLLPMVMPVIALGIALSVLLSGRNLSFVDLDPTGMSVGVQYVTLGSPHGATWPLRFATLYILAASFALIIAHLYRRQPVQGHGWVLLLGFVTLFVTNTVFPAALGTKPDFVLNHYYPLVVFLAAFATSAHSPEVLLRFAKASLLALLVGSLALAYFQPSLVMQRPYLHGWVPGMNFRLWGLASHANSIGPLALLYLLLEFHSPYRRRWLHWLGYASALGVLVLAQSKTAWVATFFLLGILAYYKVAPKFRQAWVSGQVDYQAMVVAFTTIVAGLGLLVLVVTVDLSIYWGRFIRSSAGEQMLSLTGRSQIWEVAIEVWRANPWFGYGPTLWDAEFRKAIGMSFAFSAHNQFLQTLAGAGMVGIIGLAIYIVTLLWFAVNLARATRGLSLALALFLMIRCMTETPLTVTTLFNGDLLAHVLIFGFLGRVSASISREKSIFADPRALLENSLRAA